VSDKWTKTFATETSGMAYASDDDRELEMEDHLAALRRQAADYAAQHLENTGHFNGEIRQAVRRNDLTIEIIVTLESFGLPEVTDTTDPYPHWSSMTDAERDEAIRKAV
jgi:hypothetical protein